MALSSWVRQLFEQDGTADAPVQTDGGTETLEETNSPPVVEEPTAGHPSSEEMDATDEGLAGVLTVDDVLDALPVAVFVLSPTREVLHWNAATERLCGTPREEVLGTDEVSVAFYQDGRRAMTLADKVVEAPRDADREYGVNRSKGDTLRYEDTSTMLDATGEEIEIWFTAQPVFRDGEFVAVVEMVHDRSEEVARRHAVEGLVGEVTGTLAALGKGELQSRARLPAGSESLEDDLTEVVDQVNETASRLERVVENVQQDTERLSETVQTAADRADDISNVTADQRTSLRVAADELDSFGAAMQQIAASAGQVADNADRAREAAVESASAGTDASEATERIVAAGETLSERVESLDERVGDVVAIADVIADVAEQTNLLALNANIEAARVGAEGSGFEVVADEVKSLASETREHADEIATEIATVREEVTATVEAVERSNEQIHDAGGRIGDALDGLEHVERAVDEAADGIDEVATANEQQAAALDSVSSAVEEATDRAADAHDTAQQVAEAADVGAEAVTALESDVAELCGGTDAA